MKFKVILEPEPEGGYTVICPDVKGAVSYGETVEEALVYWLTFCSVFHHLFHDYISIPRCVILNSAMASLHRAPRCFAT